MDSLQPLICPDPIFVIGCPRSGTAILADSLAKHSQLFNLMETTILSDLFGDGKALAAYRSSMERPAPTMLQAFRVKQDEFLTCLGTGINMLFTSKSEGKRWIDKTPQYTLIADLLLDMFPGAYFIHILRDGRRVVNSMMNLHNAPDREKQRHKFGPLRERDFRNACRTWSRYVGTALDFVSRHPTRCLTARNEALVTHPTQGFRTILEFICAPYEDAPAEHFATHQINSSFWPAGRIDSPLPSRFSDPWATWNAEQRQIFEEETGQTMAGCGFVLPQRDAVVAASSGKAEAKSLPAKTALDSVSLNNRTFILLSVARSGSNLLRDYLNQHNSVRCFGEVFKKSFVNEKDWQFFASMDSNIDRLHADDLVSFWKLALEHYELDHPVIGAKIFYYHREGNEIWRYFASSRTPIIHLVREELIDSYLSLKLAEASGVWKQPRKKMIETDYERNIYVDLIDFKKYCTRMQRYIKQARALFQNNPCLNLSYSSLINDRDNIMRAVYSFLGLPDQPTSSRLVKQRSHNREELIINWTETADFITNNPHLCSLDPPVASDENSR
jgi:LPS sulfotransferase NodH